MSDEAKRKQRAQELARLAKKIGRVRRDADTIGTVGYLLGAVYALRSALDHEPRAVVNAGGVVAEAYDREVAAVARDLANGLEPAQPLWITGFHFHSALHRIAAACDRIPQVVYKWREGKSPSKPERDAFWKHDAILIAIFDQVNWLKHRRGGSSRVPPPTNPNRDRLVTVADALAGLKTIVDRASEEWKA